MSLVDNLVNKYPNIDRYKLIIMYENFRTVFSIGDVKYINISPVMGAKYRGDYYGLLNELRVPPDLYYPILRINNLDSSSNYDGKTLEVIIPDLNRLSMQKNILNTRKL